MGDGAMSHTTQYTIFGSLIFGVAIMDAVGSLLGFWSESGVRGQVLLGPKGLVLVGLVLLSFSTKYWVYQRTSNPRHRMVARLSVASILLCMGGDIVNANVANSFYRYGGSVKHDYLAESVIFFGPGYFLLLVTGILIALDTTVKGWVMYSVLLIGALFGVVSLMSMHLPGTGVFVTAMTVGYAALIGAVALFGCVVVHSMGGMQASLGVWLVGLGFVLAGVADAVIGAFWIYGNGGEGFYPTVRQVNWILYVGSQCLVIYLPYAYTSRTAFLADEGRGHSRKGNRCGRSARDSQK